MTAHCEWCPFKGCPDCRYQGGTHDTEQGRRGEEQHLCPLQLDIVERLIRRFSAAGDLVYDPFAGVGTVPLVALQMGRRGAGTELNPGYWADGCAYLREQEAKSSAPTLFDVVSQAERCGADSETREGWGS